MYVHKTEPKVCLVHKTDSKVDPVLSLQKSRILKAERKVLCCLYRHALYCLYNIRKTERKSCIVCTQNRTDVLYCLNTEQNGRLVLPVNRTEWTSCIACTQNRTLGTPCTVRTQNRNQGKPGKFCTTVGISSKTCLQAHN